MIRTTVWHCPSTSPMPSKLTPQRVDRLTALHHQWPGAIAISIAERGLGDRLTPAPLEVMYVMSGHGRYGRAAEVRVGRALTPTGLTETFRASDLGF